MKSSPDLSIGAVAARFGLATHVLRHWESVGLLTPARAVAGRRRYGTGHLYRIAAILRAKEAGFALDDIREMFAVSDPADRVAILRRNRADLAARIAAARASLDLVDCALRCDHDDLGTCPHFRALIADRAGLAGLAQPPPPAATLVIVNGEEGAGKSTIVRALLPHTPDGARIDAEDLGQTNPCPMDDRFFDLLRRNVAGLVENYWAAGYHTVVAGSFLRHNCDYRAFRDLLTRPSTVFLVELLVDKAVRDHRRITRAKQTTQEWRDMVDTIPDDLTIRQATDADYRYIGVDTTDLDVAGTVERITAAIPEVYGRRPAVTG